jgi:polysaccharide export outer membrane protein
MACRVLGRWPTVLLVTASVCWLALASACHSTFTYDYKSEPDPRHSEFRVGPLDALSIVVWNHKELSSDVSVRPDGVITLPLIGDVPAAGRTPSEIEKDIAKRLSEYIKNGEIVSVAVQQVNSYYFTVAGNVEKAGYYSPKTYVTAVEAVAMAGGPNKYAGDSMYVVRANPPRRIPISLSRATSGASPEQNVVVLRGDVIVVP